MSLPNDFTFRHQPTPVTCVHACLAMALDVPVEKVIERYGPDAMSHKQLISALNECRFYYNQMVYGTLVASGWYFLAVPSLNNRGGSHQILVHNNADAGCSGFTVLDPSPRESYKVDGSDLHAWWNPILFVPGGTLPENNFLPQHRDISSPPPPSMIKDHLPGHLTEFSTQGSAIDAVLAAQYKYYCLGQPALSDHQFDMLLREIEKRWPKCPIIEHVGGDTVEFYPDYIKDGRWPSPEEREARNKQWGLTREQARSLGHEDSRPILTGVGMPMALKLDEFGSHIWSVFGEPPYLVGSALRGKDWRDVDVRMIISDEEWDRWNFGDPCCPHRNEKWVSLCQAYAALGNQMTNLPIDFQIQQRTSANAEHPGPRSAIGMIPRRFQQPIPPADE